MHEIPACTHTHKLVRKVAHLLAHMVAFASSYLTQQQILTSDLYFPFTKSPKTPVGVIVNVPFEQLIEEHLESEGLAKRHGVIRKVKKKTKNCIINHN